MLSYISVGNPVVQFVCYISSSYYSSVPEKYQLSAKSNDSAIFYNANMAIVYGDYATYLFEQIYMCLLVVGECIITEFTYIVSSKFL